MKLTDTNMGQYIQLIVLTVARYILPTIVCVYVTGEFTGRFFFTKYLPYHNHVVRPALRYAFTINDL